MKKTFTYLSSFLLISCLLSCSLEDHVMPIEPDVYVAGFSVEGEVTTAKYWKNGNEVVLLSSSSSKVAALEIAVSGKDVHVVGYELADGRARGIYWKNNVEVTFRDSTKPYSLRDVKIVGSDVYLAGSIANGSTTSDTPAYWKNGTPVLLSGKESGFATSVAVSGSDIYVAGYSRAAITDKLIAKYWKNGEPVNLSDGAADTYASKIVVSNGDVHVVGYERSNTIKAKYWKNGVEVPLAGWQTGSNATDIYVSSDDVIIAGHSANGKAAYWKNGVTTQLAPSVLAFAWGLAVYDGVMYIAGDINQGSGVAVYWKDGKQVTLSDGKSSSVTEAISVVRP